MSPKTGPKAKPRGRRRRILGRRLTAARIAAGLTQAKLAEQLKVPTSTLRNWETGRTRPLPVYLRVVERFLRGE